MALGEPSIILHPHLTRARPHAALSPPQLKDKDNLIDSLKISLEEIKGEENKTTGILKMVDQIQTLSNEKRYACGTARALLFLIFKISRADPFSHDPSFSAFQRKL